MEDPEKGSKEEWNEAELKGAEALKENLKKHKTIATAHIHEAKEKGTDSEDESKDKEGITEDEPSKPEPAWEGVETGKNPDPKIIGTSHNLGVLQAKSLRYNIDLAREEVGNYPMTMKDRGNVVPEQRDRPKNQSENGDQPAGEDRLHHGQDQ